MAKNTHSDFKRFFNLANINKIFLVLLILAVFFTAYNLAIVAVPRFLKINIDKMDLAGAEKQILFKKSPKSDIIIKRENFELKLLSHYTEEIKKRSLFEFIVADEAASAGRISGDFLNSELERARNNFNLKGIVSGTPPQAIIEDISKNKTYFVTKGENIEEFIVEKITYNKVELKLGDESVYLTL